MDRMRKSITKLDQGSRMTPLLIPPDTMEFLSVILRPKRLHCDSSIGEFIRNETLREIREKIQDAQARGGY